MQSFLLYRETSPEWPNLTREDQLFVNSTLDDYEDIFKPFETFMQISQLQFEISHLEAQAQKALSEDTTKIEVEVRKLKGLPFTSIEKLEKVPNKPGYRYISMAYPELVPALTEVEDEETRKRLKIASSNKT